MIIIKYFNTFHNKHFLCHFLFYKLLSHDYCLRFNCLRVTLFKVFLSPVKCYKGPGAFTEKKNHLKPFKNSLK